MAREFLSQTGDDYIKYANKGDPGDGTGGSWSMLLKPNAYDGNKAAWMHANSGELAALLLYMWSSNGTPALLDLGGGIFQQSSDTGLPTDRVTNLVITWPGSTTASTCFIYVDGVQQVQINNDSSGMTAATGSLFIGGHTAQESVNGLMSDLGFWHGYVLSAGEIAALANRVSPLLVRPDKLSFAPPLIRDTVDPITGDAGTIGGTAAVVPHSRMVYPSNFLTMGIPAAVAAVGNPYYAYAQQ